MCVRASVWNNVVMARRCAALVVACALLTTEAALTQCLVSCEASRMASRAFQPHCHRTDAPGVRVGATPGTCGHDHNQTIPALASERTADLRVVPVVALSSVNRPPLNITRDPELGSSREF